MSRLRLSSPSFVSSFASLLLWCIAASLGCAHADIVRAPVHEAADARASLPNVIDIATATQGSNLFGDYALAGGLLYHRTDASSAWALVDGVGLPNLDGAVLPEVKGKLTRLFADGNIIAVVDEQDQVFRYDTNLGVLNLEPTLYAWRTEWGTGILKLRKDLRAISYGRRMLLNVGVVDDRFGYQLLASNPSSLISVFHENGYSGLMHFYGLSLDGKRLFFADNGLTKVFNYEFDVPRADDFVGVALASSASMVVILDSKGRLWSKFLDFDWYGSNPMMFEYSYVDEKDGKNDEPEGFGRIHIPLPNWRELPPPPLGDNASISTEMGMVVTGKGNQARELRIRGHKDGHCGLYLYELDKKVWTFKTTDICANDADQFKAVTNVPRVHREVTLTGDLTVDGVPYHATLSDYTLVDSPVRLELVDVKSGAVAFRGLLHMVPGWSPLEVVDPGRDGRYKLMYGTVEADAGFENNAIARGRNLRSFELTAWAAEDELLLKPLRDDQLMGKLVRESGGGYPDEIAAFLARAPSIPKACAELRARVDADRGSMLEYTSVTPALNLFGLVTGTRFWYHHGISMIPPLGRLMDWGTRLFYDRYQLNRYETDLVARHCR